VLQAGFKTWQCLPWRWWQRDTECGGTCCFEDDEMCVVPHCGCAGRPNKQPPSQHCVRPFGCASLTLPRHSSHYPCVQVTVLDHQTGSRQVSSVSDPMDVPVQLSRNWRPAAVEGVPAVFTGGWVGYAGYDTVRYVYGSECCCCSAFDISLCSLVTGGGPNEWCCSVLDSMTLACSHGYVQACNATDSRGVI
jgi:hypothetical protein